MSILRKARIVGDIAYIPLTKGYEVIIDRADLSFVDKWNWHAAPYAKTVYGRRSSERDEFGKKSPIYLHRVLMEAPRGLEVDHINGNGLDCRRCNMRLVTHQQNSINCKPRSHNKSGLKGAFWSTSHKVWYSAIVLNGKSKYLGRFHDPFLAHKAYCEASAIIHGTYGRTQ